MGANRSPLSSCLSSMNFRCRLRVFQRKCGTRRPPYISSRSKPKSRANSTGCQKSLTPSTKRFEPGAGLATQVAIARRPFVGMIAKRKIDKCERGLDPRAFKKFPCRIRRSFHADKLGPSMETLQSLSGRVGIAFRIWPGSHAILMRMAKKCFSELANGFIAEPDIVTGNRPA